MNHFDTALSIFWSWVGYFSSLGVCFFIGIFLLGIREVKAIFLYKRFKKKYPLKQRWKNGKWDVIITLLFSPVFALIMYLFSSLVLKCCAITAHLILQ